MKTSVPVNPATYYTKVAGAIIFAVIMGFVGLIVGHASRDSEVADWREAYEATRPLWITVGRYDKERGSLNFRFVSLDHGKNWYVAEVGSGETRILGHAEAAYPGALAELKEAVRLRGLLLGKKRKEVM
jgi:hypothetical protein